jgi:hypothetical protein
MLPVLAVVASVIKLAMSVGLTYKTRFWWVPGTIMIAFAISLLATSAWILGAIGLGLGSLGIASAAALRAPVAATRP